MKKLILLLSIIFWMGTYSASSQINLEFMPIADSFNVVSPDAVQAININYDDIEPEKQLLHLFLPDTEGTFPLVIYIHGGGFTGGNPGSVFTSEGQRQNVKYFLDNGFAFASVGYRLIEETLPDSEGVIKCLSDSKRALQFIRYYSEELHIKPEKIAVMGTSAGAGTSLWLATRSDMADPTSADPVLRESTRVSAAYVSGSQATYDIYKWETAVYNNFDGNGTNFTLDNIAEIMSEERVQNFYGGLDSIYQIVHDPALIQYREDVDMLHHLSSDDPPIYISSQSGAVHPSDDVLHHSLHGKEIYETAIDANVSEVKADIPNQSIGTTDGESANEFLLRHLTGSEVLSVLDEIQIEVYPNPATNHISIRSTNELTKVEIISISGNLLMSKNISDHTDQIDTSTLAAGIYLMNITQDNGSKTTRRLIID